MTKATFSLALFSALLAAGSVQAQFPSRPGGLPGQRPAVSPYLNLLNNGDPAINYFGLVRPQIAFRGAIQNLQREVDTIDSRDRPFQTGHSSSFMTQSGSFGTQSRYFMTNGAASSSKASPSLGQGAPKRK